ncbi:MAG: hypothetical protein ACK4NR_07940 [Micavibrio sp.]
MAFGTELTENKQNFPVVEEKPASGNYDRLSGYSRYQDFFYTSNEGKRLLGIILDDNRHLLMQPDQSSAAYNFLHSLELVEIKPHSERYSSKGMLFDESGNLVSDVALSTSFDLTKPKERSGTLMHSFNAPAMRGAPSVSAEMVKNVDFLSKLSGFARARTKYDSLESLLDATCPDWNKGSPEARIQHNPNEQKRLL